MKNNNKKIATGSAAVDQLIPRRLKEYYDSIQDEGIPDKFLDLLERLDAAEQAARTKPQSGGD